MAYDKVIDSAKLDAAMAATANAIREKTGDAALIQWLTDRGFAEAVAGIQSGGGGGGVAMGSYVFAETKPYIQIHDRVSHGLGRVPTQMIQLLRMSDGTTVSGGHRIVYVYTNEEGSKAYQASGSTGVYLKMASSSYDTFSARHNPTETDFRLFGAYSGIYSGNGNAGDEVLWFVW